MKNNLICFSFVLVLQACASPQNQTEDVVQESSSPDVQVIANDAIIVADSGQPETSTDTFPDTFIPPDIVMIDTVDASTSVEDTVDVATTDTFILSDSGTSDAPPSCPPGQLFCGGSCVINSTANCGSCGMTCDGLHAARVSCNSSGVCIAAVFHGSGCSSGWYDCNENPADGCEVNLLDDPLNCGACGVVCRDR